MMGKWQCGMCPSCFQRRACPGRTGTGRGCNNYLAPEPTHREWPEIYKEALGKLDETRGPINEARAIGRVKALKEAMIGIHGFTLEEVERIEKER